MLGIAIFLVGLASPTYQDFADAPKTSAVTEGTVKTLEEYPGNAIGEGVIGFLKETVHEYGVEEELSETVKCEAGGDQPSRLRFGNSSWTCYEY